MSYIPYSYKSSLSMYVCFCKLRLHILVCIHGIYKKIDGYRQDRFTNFLLKMSLVHIFKFSELTSLPRVFARWKCRPGLSGK